MRTFALSIFKPVTLKIGSSRTILLGEGKKILVDEPAAIARSVLTGEVVGFGEQAVTLSLSGSPDIEVSPLFSGGIPLDEEKCVQYLQWIRKKLAVTLARRILPIPVVSVVSTQLPAPYRKAFSKSLQAAHFLPLAFVPHIAGEYRNAVGGSGAKQTVLLIRLGATLTQMGIYSGGTLVHADTLLLGGDDFNLALQLYIHQTFSVTVPLTSLTTLKENYTQTKMNQSEFSVILRGKDKRSGVLRSVQLSGQDFAEVSRLFFENVASQAFFKLRAFREIIADTHGQFYLSGGLSVMPEATKAFQDTFGKNPQFVHRPHLAGVLGVATLVERKEL